MISLPLLVWILKRNGGDVRLIKAATGRDSSLRVWGFKERMQSRSGFSAVKRPSSSRTTCLARWRAASTKPPIDHCWPPVRKISCEPARHFPQPLGPTTAVTPGSKRSCVESANDLNPRSSSFLNLKWRVAFPGSSRNLTKGRPLVNRQRVLGVVQFDLSLAEIQIKIPAHI